MSRSDGLDLLSHNNNFLVLAPSMAFRVSSSVIRSIRIPETFRPFSTTSHFCAKNTNISDWAGRPASEHVTNRDDNEPDIQSSASKSGKEERTGESGYVGSGAANEKDLGNQNEQAKKDHPEAPGPVLGMNDERGGVSSFAYTSHTRRTRRLTRYQKGHKA